ncbi:uncharacterized protein IAS62_003328 [Cryptococcus decagattii]|uniref:Magnesium transporter NIPA-domain-containing protein n=1 Tax=Cryptococcus decagattii TaxID=1859122 RepID=A0ABZ2AXQ8_9TREE
MATTPVSTDFGSVAASVTATLFDVIATSISSVSVGDTVYETQTLAGLNDTSLVNGGMGTSEAASDDSEGNYVLNTFIGLFIVLASSVFNALGLNMTKLDHVRQQSIPKRQRKKEYMRLLWLSGMGMYIASQVFGSPLALRYLRPDWVAPLGSSSLVFNFLFAYWLVGTPVTTSDIRGTAVIILGVILIIVFSSINHGLQQSLSIERLNSLWSRPAWLAYFIMVVLFTASAYIVSLLLRSLLSSRASFSPLASPSLELPTSRSSSPNPLVKSYKKLTGIWGKFERFAVGKLEVVFQRTDDAKVTWLQGIGWAVAGGSLAGLCLVFTKAVVKIMWLPGHPLVHPSALISLLLVILTAVLQIVCLNRAIVCADTVVVVPLFYAGYTVFGFVNSLVFYDEIKQYARWVLIVVFLSIAVLISGVVLLSLKSSANTSSDPYTVSAQPSGSMRLRPRTPKSEMDAENNGEAAGPSAYLHKEEEDEEYEGVSGPGNVLWEVGSVSDHSGDEHEGEEERSGKGVGGVKGGTGERRGLLGEEEQDVHEGEDKEGEDKKGETRNPFDDEDDGFGEYEGVNVEEEQSTEHR